MSLETLHADYEHVFDRGDGTYVALHRLMFHWTMIVGLIDDEQGYDDRWCYGRTEAEVVAAHEEWRSRNYEGEPTGWTRHPPSGRRRVAGDPATEYINH